MADHPADVGYYRRRIPHRDHHIWIGHRSNEHLATPESQRLLDVKDQMGLATSDSRTRRCPGQHGQHAADRGHSASICHIRQSCGDRPRLAEMYTIFINDPFHVMRTVELSLQSTTEAVQFLDMGGLERAVDSRCVLAVFEPELFCCNFAFDELLAPPVDMLYQRPPLPLWISSEHHTGATCFEETLYNHAHRGKAIQINELDIAQCAG